MTSTIRTTVSRRRGLAATTTVLPLLVLLVTAAAWAGELPDTIAVHWSGSTPDRFGNPVTYFWCALGIAIAATCAATVVTIRGTADDRLWLPATALVSWTAASTWIMSVALTRHAGSAEDARIGPWIVVPLLGIAWALLAFALAPASPHPPAGNRPVLDTPLSPTERVSWTQRVRGRWALVLATVMATAALASFLLGQWWIALLFALLVVVAGAFASVTVQVDQRGVSLSSWGLRWKRVPLDTIESATVTRIVPVQWGGSGYRFTPRGTAVVVRGGEGIVLEKKNGRPFAITVDSANDGAALINSLVAAT
ncbi:DUF1648 domain-containing protein [Rhodococcus sp. NPDC058521]|uniref:DUF1648 domain-containing protein n=1 Tax=Rhodococcus sp. NPDC058521 TaxID=3346536 RepID=UPI00365096F7